MYEALSLIGDFDILVLADGEYTQPRSTVLTNKTVMIVSQKKGAWGLSRYHADSRFTHTIAALLPRHMREYPLVIGRYLWPISQLVIPANVPMIVDLDDFKYRYSREVGFSVRILAERIKKSFSHWLARRTSSKTIPTLVVCGKSLLFVGSLWYQPNADGVDWFLTRVWLEVKRVISEAQLTMIGAASPKIRSRWEKNAGVTAPGFVDNLAAAYAAAALVIEPIHVGGGSNIKVLEALAHARPCVVSCLTASAFNDQLHHSRHFLAADTAPQFIRSVLQVLQSPEAYRTMTENGVDAGRTQFSAEKFKAEVVSFAQEVLA